MALKRMAKSNFCPKPTMNPSSFCRCRGETLIYYILLARFHFTFMRAIFPPLPGATYTWKKLSGKLLILLDRTQRKDKFNMGSWEWFGSPCFRIIFDDVKEEPPPLPTSWVAQRPNLSGAARVARRRRKGGGRGQKTERSRRVQRNRYRASLS